MKTPTIFRNLLSLVILTGFSTSAYAQIGPDLRPPGLAENHPVDSYTLEGKKNAHMFSNWDLNAADVVFSAAKKRQLISEAPSTIHVITAREIRAHGWRTLAEILRHIPGIQTLTTESQFQSVMIRGLVGTEDNNSRILWLQNGIPLNDVRNSGLWLDDTYPVEMIKRIEVVLGPGSALYGSGAFQGVINIFTKDPSDINPNGEYRVAIGNNLTFKASAIAAWESENGDFGILGHVAGNYTQGPGLIGDYVYNQYLKDQANTNVSNSKPNDYGWLRGINSNSDKKWYNINLKLNYKSLKLNLGFNDIYAGRDGSEIVSNIQYKPTYEDAYNNDLQEGLNDQSVPVKDNGEKKFYRREFYSDITYDKKLTEDLSFLGVLSYRFMQYQYGGYNLENDPPVYIFNEDHENIDTNTQDNDTIQHKFYGLAQLQWQIYEANELIAGAGVEVQAINDPDFLNGRSEYGEDGIEGNINPAGIANSLGYTSISGFIQDEQRFWNDRIILTAGARIDAYRINDENPDIAPSWRLAFLGKWTDWMTMRLSYGHAFKAPSLFQRYIQTADYINNPTLEPEELENVELAFLFTPTYNLKIRLDGFFTYMQNLIIMTYANNYADAYLGVDGKYFPKQDKNSQDKNPASYLGGFELSADYAITENWNIYGHFNLLISKEKTQEGEWQDISDDAIGRFALGATYINSYLTADLAMFMVTGTDSLSEESQKSHIPFYAILQPQITVALPANFGLMFQASLAFSQGMDKSPTWKYYYEKAGVPVDRYSGMISLIYPYQ